MLDWLISWLRKGEEGGAGREADRMDWIFPLDITYTLQKSGAPFATEPGTSVALNLRRGMILKSQETFCRVLE